MKFILYLVVAVFAIWFIVRHLKSFFAKRFIIKRFSEGSTLTCGMKRRGKDMLFNYVINTRRKPYISNVDYSKRYKRIDLEPLQQFNINGNTCHDFIIGSIKPYEYPYPDGIDYYISDAGVYFPSQECNTLTKRYPSFPLFQAISAQLGGCNIHWNVQNANRLWDKAREQCDHYFYCLKTKVNKFTKTVKMRLRYYDNLDSCIARRKPMKRRFGRLGKIEFDKFTAQYGEIKEFLIFFHLPYRYDDRIFKTKLKGDNLNETESV